ncbi:ankyrin repeat domain-containing protein [Elusimicrobium minutum]|nr:ankyrin repeat domain-containing protein [Elusimicrobium minutum]
MKKILIIAIVLVALILGYKYYQKNKGPKMSKRAKQRAAEKAAQETVAEEVAKLPPSLPTEEQKRYLFLMAAKSDTKSIKSVLEQNVSPDFSVNMADMVDNFPLFRSEIKQPLLAYIEPNTTNWTLVFMAVASNNTELVKYLNERNADFKVKGPNGEDLVAIAAKHNNISVLEILLNNGLAPVIDPTDKNNYLSLAFQTYNIPLATIIYKGAVKNNIDVSSLIPDFEKSIAEGREHFINFLIENTGADLNQTFKNGMSVMHVAAANLQADTVRNFALKGIDLDLKDNNGRTPLFYTAGQTRSEKTINFLVENGADINVQDNNGVTPLLLAISKKDDILTNKLLDAKADVNLADFNGFTPLMMAIQTGNYTLANKIIEAGANVNTQAKNGTTALMLAARRGSYSMCRTLVQKGASNRFKNKEGLKASDIAVQRGYVNIFDMLEKN